MKGVKRLLCLAVLTFIYGTAACAQEAVALLYPQTGACYTPEADVTVWQDAQGVQAEHAALFLNGRELEAAGAAYTKNIGPLPPGNYALQSRVTDKTGRLFTGQKFFTVIEDSKETVMIAGDGSTVCDGSFNSYTAQDGNTLPMGWDGKAVYEKGGRISAHEVEKEMGMSLKIENTGSASSIYPYLQSPTYTGGLTGQVVVGAKIRCENASSATRTLSIRDSSGSIDMMSINSDTIKIHFLDNGTVNTQSSGIASYQFETWYDVKFMIDTKTSRYDFYLNGICLAEQKEMVRPVGGIRNFKISQGGKQKAVTYIDDIYVYTVKAQPRLLDAFLENSRGRKEEFSDYARICAEKIRLSFSEEMDVDSFSQHFRLLDENGEGVSAVPKKEGNDIILTADREFERGSYTLELEKGMAAKSGAVLQNTIYRGFRCAGYRMKVKELKFMDLSANQLLYLEDASGARAYAQCTVNNISNDTQEVCLITGIYSGDTLEAVDIKRGEAEPEKDLTIRSKVINTAALKGDAIKAYIWDRDFSPLTICETLQSEKTPGTLIFQSGFEPGTKGDSNTELKKLSGKDNTLDNRNDWEMDLNRHPNIGSLSFEYETGSTAERYAALSPAPDAADNTVLKFCQKSVESASKGRVQASIYGNENLPSIRYRFKMYLGDGFSLLKKSSEEITWFTMAEFWNQPGWGNYPYPYRVSFGLYKPAGIGQELYFKVGSDICKPFVSIAQWTQKNLEETVCVGQWLDCEIYYREGDDNEGRFYFAVKKENEKRKVILDVRDRTHDPESRVRHGLTHFNPWKLYTAKGTVNGVRDFGGDLTVYWDDVSFWKEG